jgi:hypothetical protein
MSLRNETATVIPEPSAAKTDAKQLLTRDEISAREGGPSVAEIGSSDQRCFVCSWR